MGYNDDDENDAKEDDMNEQEQQFLTMGDEKKQTTVKLKSSLPRQQSNIATLERYRSRNQLNKAGRAELGISSDLKEELLPSAVTRTHIEEEWSLKESFEVIKYVISKHE